MEARRFQEEIGRMRDEKDAMQSTINASNSDEIVAQLRKQVSESESTISQQR